MKKKSFLILVSISLISIFSVCIVSFWIIVSSGYDKQNKIILNIKKIFPSHIAKQVRDKIFFIPNLQARNKFLSLQVEKYEQGLDGKLFGLSSLRLKYQL